MGPATPAPSRDHVVVLDAGKAIGGAPRELTLAVSTAGIDDVEEFGYEARLSGRALGRGTADAAGWRTLADDRGVGHPPQMLPLRFAAPALPPGVRRLRLELALRLPSPRRRLIQDGRDPGRTPGPQSWGVTHRGTNWVRS